MKNQLTGTFVIALLVLGGAAREANAGPLSGLQVFWDFNAGALDQDSTANDLDLTLRANPNALGGAGGLPTSTAGVGGGTGLEMPDRVYDARLGPPGTFYGDYFGPDPFAGGD